MVPTVDRAVAAARALKQLTQGDTTGLPEDIQIRIAMVNLGQYKVSLNRETEKRLRSFLVDAKGKEPEIRRYLAVVDSVLAGPAKV